MKHSPFTVVTLSTTFEVKLDSSTLITALDSYKCAVIQPDTSSPVQCFMVLAHYVAVPLPALVGCAVLAECATPCSAVSTLGPLLLSAAAQNMCT